jgi:hypothetical protein
MRKILLTTAVALGGIAAAVPMITTASAAEGKGAAYHCRTAAGETALPAQAIRSNLETLGYRVSRVKLDDGCLEARAMNDTGIPIEVRYHPVTGELVRASLKH